ncbi:MAG: phosphate ABC transporter permease subunit PstC [Eubacteriales bacterium]|nr:phosphate ABC transporter permease subunit PstC [Bacillota bacterium]MBV1728068.1 phosphate ABC transporter permease subunit PstC [Desulforudis sp.]MDQ7788658.1 phosphate ABC transporter permease subunit PstC [Clostridia bacterium]MDZ4043566.1 phosphate ABC transporter permease subunit PstC [Eubacteriales bacterium]MBU4532506.1 phosphate ABC transporter permease subunit PstC [Bacillota bacterium]
MKETIPVGDAVRRRIEWLIEKSLLLSAIVGTLIVMLIAVFTFLEGFPFLAKYGITSFITGKVWDPAYGEFGILSMIIGTFYVTIGALIIGVPIAVACAIFLAEMAPQPLARLFRPIIELLAGIPTVVYGFFGLIVIVGFIKSHFDVPGFSILAASIMLAIMILPTVINISEDAIRAVPKQYKEGSLALGATHWQTIRYVILPGARSGLISAIFLGMGRAIGETMAVIMVAGNTALIPTSMLDPVRTLTINIALEMGYAYGDHSSSLFATGIVLFVLIICLNALVTRLKRRVTE